MQQAAPKWRTGEGPADGQSQAGRCHPLATPAPLELQPGGLVHGGCGMFDERGGKMGMFGLPGGVGRSGAVG